MSFHKPTSDSFKLSVTEAIASGPGVVDEGKTQKQQRRLRTDEEINLEKIGIELESLSLKAAEVLSKRPKRGEIYDEVRSTVNLKSITERLRHLSMNRHISIDEAIEISDAAYLLRLLRRTNNEIELAGQMAHNAAL
ncbi:hypothetical protein SESBI_32778 [Sesbania bispinosa]|nr:hypothetical protein SESBI_32778 [Sesbania bispinosa]